MNLENYIASGILESYVLGMCSNEERLEVDRLRLEFPEIEAEIASIEDAFLSISGQFEVAPAPELKSKIWSAISEESAKHEETAIPAQEEAKIISIASKRSLNPWMAAASVALVLSLGAYSWKLNSDMKLTKNQLSNLELEKQKTEQEKIEKEKQLALLVNPSTKKVVLKSVPTFQDSKAEVTVFWNSTSQEVILSDVSLPQAPEGKQYQLWALMDGKPIDAGVFDQTAKQNLVSMKKIENSQAFAITLEEKGGSPSPHLDALCVMAAL